MSPEMQSQSLRISLTVAEPDLRDALLILYCYSCSEYEIGSSYSSRDAVRPSAAGDDPVNIAEVDIRAKCKASALQAILAELATAFGRTHAFKAICPTSTRVRQNERLEERRILVSS
jgi:hypothetical protein